MGLQMKRLGYFLFLLLIWAQVDDFWASAPVLPSAPLAGDDDEYLPAQRRLQQKESSSNQMPICAAIKAQTADFPPIRRPSEWNLTTPSAPPCLYVFMSLQI
jgi:hypothetical protein